MLTQKQALLMGMPMAIVASLKKKERFTRTYLMDVEETVKKQPKLRQIHFGFPTMDENLPDGVPQGSVIVIYGNSNSGKTSFVNKVIEANQIEGCFNSDGVSNCEILKIFPEHTKIPAALQIDASYTALYPDVQSLKRNCSVSGAIAFVTVNTFYRTIMRASEIPSSIMDHADIVVSLVKKDFHTNAYVLKNEFGNCFGFSLGFTMNQGMYEMQKAPSTSYYI